MHQQIKVRGFTLVEIIVVAPVLILIIGTIIASIVTLTGESLTEGGRSQLMGDVQDALDRIEDDVVSSGAYLATNNFNLTSPQGVDDATQKFVSVSVGGDDTLILNSFFTSSNPAISTRGLVYLPDSPYACSDAARLAQNQVMTMNIVYFVKDSALWRRTVVTGTYASKACPGVTPWQQPNCAESKMSLNPTLCKAQDELMVSNVDTADFTVLYFLAPTDVTGAADTENTDDGLRQNAIDKTSTIQVKIKATKTIAGRDVSQEGTVRAARSGSLVVYATPDP